MIRNLQQPQNETKGGKEKFLFSRSVDHFPQRKQQSNSGKRRFSSTQSKRIWEREKNGEEKNKKNENPPFFLSLSLLLTLGHLRAGAGIQIHMDFQRRIFSIVHEFGASIIALFFFQYKTKPPPKDLLFASTVFCFRKRIQNTTKSHIMLEEGRNSFCHQFANSIQFFVSFVQTDRKIHQHLMQPVQTSGNFLQLKTTKIQSC